MLSHSDNLRLESHIEHTVVEKARKMQLIPLKLNGHGHVGWPDRMFVMPGGKVIFIEFKKPGGRLSPSQHAVFTKLKSRGHLVYTCYSVDEAMEILEANK